MSEEEEKVMKEAESLVDSEHYASLLKDALEKDRGKVLKEALEKLAGQKAENVKDEVCKVYEQLCDAAAALSDLRPKCEDIAKALSALSNSARENAAGMCEISGAKRNEWAMAHNRGRACDALAQSAQLLEALDETETLVRENKMCEALASAVHARQAYIPALGACELVRAVEARLDECCARIKTFALGEVNENLSKAWEKCRTIGAREFFISAQTLVQRAEIAEQVEDEFAKKIAPSEAKSGDDEIASGQNDSVIRKAAAQAVAIAKLEGVPRLTSMDSRSLNEKLYDVVYIHRTLGILPQFVAEYSDIKKNQITKIFNMQQDRSRNLHEKRITDPEFARELLERLIGFFVIEANVCATLEDLLPRVVLQDMWHSALVRLKSVLYADLDVTKTKYALTCMTELLIIFEETAKRHHLEVSALADFFPEILNRFSSVSISEFNRTFSDKILNMPWDPMQIMNETHFHQVVTHNGLPVALPSKFPCEVPFSMVVPQFMLTIEDTISKFVHLSEFFGDVEDIMVRTIDLCLISYLQSFNTQQVQKKQELMPTGKQSSSSMYITSFAQLYSDFLVLRDVPEHLYRLVSRVCHSSKTPKLKYSIEEYQQMKLTTTFKNALIDHIQQNVIAPYHESWKNMSKTQGPASREFSDTIIQLLKSMIKLFEVMTPATRAELLKMPLILAAQNYITPFEKSKVKKILWKHVKQVKLDADKFATDLRSFPFDEIRSIGNEVSKVQSVLTSIMEPDIERYKLGSSRTDSHALYHDHLAYIAALQSVKTDDESPSGYSSRMKSVVKAIQAQYKK